MTRVELRSLSAKDNDSREGTLSMRNVCLLALLTIQNFALPLLAAERNSDFVTDVDPKNAILPDQLVPHREQIARKLETMRMTDELVNKIKLRSGNK